MDDSARRRQQVREASRRLRKRRKDEQEALHAEVKNLRKLVDQLRDELQRATRPGGVREGAGLVLAGQGAPVPPAKSQHEAKLERENEALKAQLAEVSSAVAVMTELHSMLRSSSNARRVIELLGALSTSDGLPEAATKILPAGHGATQGPVASHPAQDFGDTLSRLHAADAAVAGLAAHHLRPPRSAPGVAAGFAAAPPAAAAQAAPPAVAAPPAGPSTLVVVREAKPDGSERERRVHVAIHGAEDEAVDTSGLEAIARLLPVKRAPTLEPAAVTSEAALEQIAVDSLHTVPIFLGSGWSAAAEVVPGVFIRSRNVGQVYPARLIEAFLPTTYDDTAYVFFGILSSPAARLTLGAGAGAFTIGTDEPIHRAAVPASAMKERRKTLGRRLLRDQSAVVYELGFKSNRLPWPLQPREMLTVRAVQEVKLPSTRGLGVPTRSPDGAPKPGQPGLDEDADDGASGEDASADSAGSGSEKVASSASAAAGGGSRARDSQRSRASESAHAEAASAQRRTGRAMYSVTRSITHPDHPESVNAVRAMTYNCIVLEELEGGGCRMQIAYHSDMRGQLPLSILQRFDATFLRGLRGLPQIIDRARELRDNGEIPSSPVPRLGEELPAGGEPPASDPATEVSSGTTRAPTTVSGSGGAAEAAVESSALPRSRPRRRRRPTVKYDPEVNPELEEALAEEAGGKRARRPRKPSPAAAAQAASAAASGSCAALSTPWASDDAFVAAGAIDFQPPSAGLPQPAAASEGVAVRHGSAVASLSPWMGASSMGIGTAALSAPLSADSGPFPRTPSGAMRPRSPDSDASIHLSTLDELLAGLPPMADLDFSL